MQLYVGNKNYSSWSMRPWVLMTQFELPFEEVMLRFDGFTPDSRFKQAISRLSPTARVPLLVDDGFAVWDTLAIAEYLADKFPERPLWPADRLQRARARSLCAEMHSGFGALRSACPMNIEAALPQIGAKVLAEQPAVGTDLARIVAMWTEALEASGGPYLFGGFSIADAYFAPICARLRTYALPVPAAIEAYIERQYTNPGMAAWVRDALAEKEFLDFEEPYRSSRD
nr:glutathione S-transferase family protein [Aquabacterium terrae]